jgi:hypothetical protein
MNKTETVTLYRVFDGRLQATEFQFTPRQHPYPSYYERKVGDETERVYLENGKIEHGWCLDAETAIEEAVEKAEIRVECCEERLRVARDRLLVVQGLKR